MLAEDDVTEEVAHALGAALPTEVAQTRILTGAVTLVADISSRVRILCSCLYPKKRVQKAALVVAVPEAIHLRKPVNYIKIKSSSLTCINKSPTTSFRLNLTVKRWIMLRTFPPLT